MFDPLSFLFFFFLFRGLYHVRKAVSGQYIKSFCVSGSSLVTSNVLRTSRKGARVHCLVTVLQTRQYQSASHIPPSSPFSPIHCIPLRVQVFAVRNYK